MSTAKRLVLSLTGRNDPHQTPGASSTRLVGNSLSPGHELDEIAIVSHATESCGRVSYGSLSLNGPRYIPGEYSVDLIVRTKPYCGHFARLLATFIQIVVDRFFTRAFYESFFNYLTFGKMS